MYDVIIIGAGPAGISSALYVRRANLNVAVVYAGESQLQKAHQIENYYGFPNGISGSDLYENGILQAKNIGVEIINEEVTHIEMVSFPPDVSYMLKTQNRELLARAVIIATGNKKLRPNIEGIVELEGKGVSYCAVCDGFFYRDKNVAVIGDGTFAVAEASHLCHIAKSVTILTNGKSDDELKSLLNASGNNLIKTDTRKILKIAGEQKVSAVEFDGDEKLELDGLFVALGEAGASDFAKKLGLNIKDDSVCIDEKCATNAPGVFCAGNAAGGLLQVCKAVYEGGVAGLSAVEYIRSLKKSS